jgi:hypothetical protein
VPASIQEEKSPDKLASDSVPNWLLIALGILIGFAVIAGVFLSFRHEDRPRTGKSSLFAKPSGD